MTSPLADDRSVPYPNCVAFATTLRWGGFVVILSAVLLWAQLVVHPEDNIPLLILGASSIVLPLFAVGVWARVASAPKTVTLHSWGVAWEVPRLRRSGPEPVVIRIPFERIVGMNRWLTGVWMLTAQMPSGARRKMPLPLSDANGSRVRQAWKMWRGSRG